MYARIFLTLIAAVLLVGCGSSGASSPTPTPSSTSSLQPRQWKHSPAMTINKSHIYVATVTTTAGTFTLRLDPKVAPLTVNNFVFLARHHYFDNNIFFRVIAQFMVQTGDPTGTGFGTPGYQFKDEKVRSGYTRGTVAMANSGADTNGSQFFIVVGSAVKLDPKYTIFGHVSSGMKVVDRISNGPVQVNPGTNETSQPVNPVKINTITVR